MIRGIGVTQTPQLTFNKVERSIYLGKVKNHSYTNKGEDLNKKFEIHLLLFSFLKYFIINHEYFIQTKL